MFRDILKKMETLEERYHSYNSEVVDAMRRVMEELKRENKNIKKDQKKMKTTIEEMQNEINDFKKYYYSYCYGIFSACLKESITTRIHKGGSKLEVSNYGPIALLSVFSKLLEYLVWNKLRNFLDRNSYFLRVSGEQRHRACFTAAQKFTKP
ncbi:hypothetical protein WA026_011699 [Henosepilachna vigintioctopunctata]|uniref:Uncharacterized protein n=1 Tax=Henosepilachna vigintioctopunctata TaxID=420089 RepID=A0AAW1UGY6_9CUCU